MAQLHVKPFNMGGIIIGGIIFGIGMALLGYCPGTALAAAGRGRIDALVGGVMGGLVGAFLHARAYPFLNGTVLNVRDFGNVTINGALGGRTWGIISALGIMILFLFYFVERYEKGIKHE